MNSLKKWLICSLLIFFACSIKGQQNSKNLIGITYRQHWLIADIYKDYISHYISTGIEYNRPLYGSSHWWFTGQLIYSRLDNGSESTQPEHAHDMVFVSPGIQYNIFPYVGLSIQINLAVLRTSHCMFNGQECDQVRSAVQISPPDLVQPTVSIPITIPVYKDFLLRISPSYSTGSFNDFDTMPYSNFSIAGSVLYRF